MDKPEISLTIVRLRKERGYKSAAAFAQASGISHPVLENIEAGRRTKLDSDIITKLCRTLRVSPYEFLPDLDRAGDDVEEHAVAVARLQLMNQLVHMNP